MKANSFVSWSPLTMPKSGLCYSVLWVPRPHKEARRRRGKDLQLECKAYSLFPRQDKEKFNSSTQSERVHGTVFPSMPVPLQKTTTIIVLSD